MKKPESLRQHLLSSVVDLKHDPDRLLIFVDKGNIRCTLAEGFSYEYAYTLHVIVQDFAGELDAIAIPLLQWLRVNQSELLANLDNVPDKIKFIVDVLDNSKVDVSIFIPLTERVIVEESEPGTLIAHYPPEPQYTKLLPPTAFTVLDTDGNNIASFTSPIPPAGALSLAMPYPNKVNHE